MDSVEKYVNKGRLIEIGFLRALSLKQLCVSLSHAGGSDMTVFLPIDSSFQVSYRVL